MAEMLEEKWPKGVMASIAFFFVLILMLATVAPNKLVDTVMLKERKWGIELLGDSDMEKVLEKTNRYYSALVIDSGAKDCLRHADASWRHRGCLRKKRGLVVSVS